MPEEHWAHALAHREGTHLPAVSLRADLETARCVSADSPVLLIQTGLLSRDLAAHCPIRLDPSGMSYDIDQHLAAGVSRTRANVPEYQQAMLACYGGGDAAMFVRLGSGDGLSPATWAALRLRLPIASKTGPVIVLARPWVRG